MISRQCAFHSDFPFASPFPFFRRGSCMRLSQSSEARWRGKLGQFTEEHFISWSLHKERRGIRKSQHDGRLYWGAFGGVELWCSVSRWGRECFSSSLVGGTCLCSVPNWASPCSFHPGLFSVASLWFSPNLLPLQSNTPFLKLSWSDLYEVGKGRLNHTPKGPWLLCVLRTSLVKSPSGQPEWLKYGLGLEMAWGLLGFQLSSTRLRLAKWHRTNLIPFEPQFPSRPCSGKKTTLFCWSSVAGREVLSLLLSWVMCAKS